MSAPITKRPVVLVADDDPTMRLLVAETLEPDGIEVVEEPDGAAALTTLRERTPDLVLLDVQMPVMGGLEAAAHIRALPDPARAATPIVAVTANAMKGDREVCIAAGMNGYLTKPINAAALLEEVGRHTAAR